VIDGDDVSELLDDLDEPDVDLGHASCRLLAAWAPADVTVRPGRGHRPQTVRVRGLA
jgi:hypothetical protein